MHKFQTALKPRLHIKHRALENDYTQALSKQTSNGLMDTLCKSCNEITTLKSERLVALLKAKYCLRSLPQAVVKWRHLPNDIS